MLRNTLFWPRKPEAILRKHTIPVDNVDELCKLFGWANKPEIPQERYAFSIPEDLNLRRVHDAEVLGTVACNTSKAQILEIGTATGKGTALLAQNAKKGHVYTLNVPPEEILADKAGNFTTKAFATEEIGSHYRKAKLKNITQIFANTATWKPDLENLDLVFVDGAHDKKFVYNDALLAKRILKPGGFIAFHDYNLELMYTNPWMYDVSLAVARLYSEKKLTSRIYHLRDSWVGLVQIN